MNVPSPRTFRLRRQVITPTGPKFYVNIPYATHSYAGFEPCVIEGIVSDGLHGRFFKVLGPSTYKWGVARADHEFGGWAETTGPARFLEIEEHAAIIAALTEADTYLGVGPKSICFRKARPALP